MAREGEERIMIDQEKGKKKKREREREKRGWEKVSYFYGRQRISLKNRMLDHTSELLHLLFPSMK